MSLRLVIGFVFISFVFKAHSQRWDFDAIDFSEADKRAASYKGESLDDLQNLVYNLTNNLKTDVERYRSIYMWVCANVKNDYSLYSKNKRKRKRYRDDSLKLEEWNDKFKKRVFKTLLKRKRTICTGYAYMVQTLSQLANIECKIINGFGRTITDQIEDYKYPNHSWNAVKLNGKWYLCDPTWASGIQDSNNGRFKFFYNDGLFLTSPELFSINHFPIEEEWFLFEGVKPTFIEFIEAPIVYNQAYNYLKRHISPKKLNNEISKNYTINFQYNLKPNVIPKKITFLIDNGETTETVLPDKIERDDAQLSIYKKIIKSGFYDLHLKFDNELIATYTFKVSNANLEKD